LILHLEFKVIELLGNHYDFLDNERPYDPIMNPSLTKE